MCIVCVQSCVVPLKPDDLAEKRVRFTSFQYSLPVGDIRRYFYSMAAGIQQEQRNLSKIFIWSNRKEKSIP